MAAPRAWENCWFEGKAKTFKGLEELELRGLFLSFHCFHSCWRLGLRSIKNQWIGSTAAYDNLKQWGQELVHSF